VRGVQVRNVFVGAPDDVCVWYELEVDHPVGSNPIAEWFHLTGELISEMRMILDTGPFVATTGGQQTAAKAVDPLCLMTVSRASAAATHEHAGTTYYFCSPGCATVFENEPEEFLVSAR
jgi:YHS domain-containing protein